jgi:hypothetical protein
MHPPADLLMPNLPLLPAQDGAAAMHTVAAMGIADAIIDSVAGYTSGQARLAHEICDKLGRSRG